MTTMTTVGFGDYTGRTSMEYVLSMICEMYGLILSSLLLGLMVQYAKVKEGTDFQ